MKSTLRSPLLIRAKKPTGGIRRSRKKPTQPVYSSRKNWLTNWLTKRAKILGQERQTILLSVAGGPKLSYYRARYILLSVAGRDARPSYILLSVAGLYKKTLYSLSIT